MYKPNLLKRAVSVGIYCFLLYCNYVFAQCIPSTITTTTISTANTVVNAYYPGNANAAVGSTSVTVGSKRGTAPDIADGDLLLVIQMQGVEINTTLPDNLTDVAGTNGDYADGDGGNDRRGFINNSNYIAGRYEFVVASGAVSGGILNIRTGLTNSYVHNLTPVGGVGVRTFQVVRVANYQELILSASGSITALPWNGRSGGIVVIDVNNQFTLNGTIQVNGMGFRGGGRFATEVVNDLPGHRGEGIAGTPRLLFDGSSLSNNLSDHSTSAFSGSYAGTSTYPGTASGNFDSDRGAGAPGNAGGAGIFDGGGGGGSNGGNGGFGSQDNGASSDNNSIGALLLDAQGGNRLFLGGGGGSGGRDNEGGDNDATSSGQPGGGIIFIRATTITGAGILSANGNSGGSQLLEGAGGGGGGGTVLVTTTTANLSGLTIQAIGGNGGNVTEDRDGGGGGGGGGAVLLNRIGGTFSALPTINNAGGTAGTSGTNTTAGSGGSGGLSLSTLPGSAFVCSLSALPVSLLSLKAAVNSQSQVVLSWITLNEQENDFFAIERSEDGILFQEIGRREGAGNSNTLKNYQFIDPTPVDGLSYYRLRQTDRDGRFVYSPMVSIEISQLSTQVRVFPNPAEYSVNVECPLAIQSIIIRDMRGQQIKSYPFNQSQTAPIELDVFGLARGLYWIEIVGKQQRIIKKLIIR